MLVAYKKGSNFREKVYRIETKSKRRFYNKMRLLGDRFDCFLKVWYIDGGPNEGYFPGKEDLLMAYEAFCEKPNEPFFN